jgi:hypothetical protein
MTAVHPDADGCNFGDLEGQSYGQLSEPPVRTSTAEKCLMCGQVGNWSSLYADAVFVAAPGHKLEYLEGDHLIVLDSCGNHLVP